MAATTATTRIEPPTFKPPRDADDPDRYEVWCLRAPVHFDVEALLDGATIDVNSTLLSSSPLSMSGGGGGGGGPSSNNVLARFRSGKNEERNGGDEYALIIAEDAESQGTRLLVPDRRRRSGDDDDDEPLSLRTCGPFRRQVNLMSASALVEGGGGALTELVLAPAAERAPAPALGGEGNGVVDAMRLAYVPVPQRGGLKRRWAMPGVGIGVAAGSVFQGAPATKKARGGTKPAASGAGTKKSAGAEKVSGGESSSGTNSKAVSASEMMVTSPGVEEGKTIKNKKSSKKRSK